MIWSISVWLNRRRELMADRRRLFTFLASAVAASLVGYGFVLSPLQDELSAAVDQEPILEKEFASKLPVAASLVDWRKRKLSTYNEVMALETGIFRDRTSRRLANLMMDGAVKHNLSILHLENEGVPRFGDYLAEEFASLRIIGSFQDFAEFLEDLTHRHSNNLTLRQMRWTGTAGLSIELEATVAMARYLSREEMMAEQLAKAAAAKKVDRR